MSPRLILLLTNVRNRHPLERRRDRIDAWHAATRLPTPVRLVVMRDDYVLPEAA